MHENLPKNRLTAAATFDHRASGTTLLAMAAKDVAPLREEKRYQRKSRYILELQPRLSQLYWWQICHKEFTEFYLCFKMNIKQPSGVSGKGMENRVGASKSGVGFGNNCEFAESSRNPYYTCHKILTPQSHGMYVYIYIYTYFFCIYKYIDKYANIYKYILFINIYF